jgi:hypothetical protein
MQHNTGRDVHLNLFFRDEFLLGTQLNKLPTFLPYKQRIAATLTTITTTSKIKNKTLTTF